MSGSMIRFVRYTCQGIAIACLGTIGLSHTSGLLQHQMPCLKWVEQGTKGEIAYIKLRLNQVSPL